MMLSQFLSNEKVLINESNSYFKISPKQRIVLNLKKGEEHIVKEASERIKRKLLEM